MLQHLNADISWKARYLSNLNNSNTSLQFERSLDDSHSTVPGMCFRKLSEKQALLTSSKATFLTAMITFELIGVLLTC